MHVPPQDISMGKADGTELLLMKSSCRLDICSTLGYLKDYKGNGAQIESAIALPGSTAVIATNLLQLFVCLLPVEPSTDPLN